jgi:hypothetical protein
MFEGVRDYKNFALDPLQFAYRPNRSTDDAIALHTALSQLDKWNTYVRMLFLDVLMGRPQVVKIGNNPHKLLQMHH